MAINVNLNDVLSGFLTASAITENNTRIEDAFQDALSRKPASNNAMETVLDMGGYPITNIAYDPNDETSAVTKAIFDTLVTGVETLVSSFQTQYYGADSSDPSTDPEGGTPIAGALYFNTSNNVMRVYNGSTWQDAV